MFGIGGFELFIILVFGFLIFGPDKLPEIARTIGKGVARFRDAQQEMNETLGDEKIFDPNNAEEPFKNPVEVLDKLAQKQEERKSGHPTGKREERSANAKETPARQPASEKPQPSIEREGDDSHGGESRAESFTERKARYERERAARKAAEAQAAKDRGAEEKAQEASAQEEPLAPSNASILPDVSKSSGSSRKSDEGGDA